MGAPFRLAVLEVHMSRVQRTSAVAGLVLAAALAPFLPA